MAVPTIVPILLLLLLAAMLAVIAFGATRRVVPVEPRCGRCGYDVRGLDAVRAAVEEATAASAPRPEDGSTACPECGVDLAEPGAIAFAELRRRRWPMVVIPALLLLVLGSGGVVMALTARTAAQRAVAARGVGTVTPPADVAARLAADDAPPELAGAAALWLADPSLAEEDRATLVAALDEVRERDPDVHRDAVLAAGPRLVGGDPELEALVEAAVAEIPVRLSPRARTDDRLRLEIDAPEADASLPGLRTEAMTARAVSADGAEPVELELERSNPQIEPNVWFARLPLAEGRWTIELSGRLAPELPTTAAARFAPPGAATAPPPPAEGRSLAFRRAVAIDVVGPTEPTIEWTTDPELADVAQRTWRVVRVELSETFDRPHLMVRLATEGRRPLPTMARVVLEIPSPDGGAPERRPLGVLRDDGRHDGGRYSSSHGASVPDRYHDLAPAAFARLLGDATVRLEPLDHAPGGVVLAGPVWGRPIDLAVDKDAVRIVGLLARRPTLVATAVSNAATEVADP